MLEKDISFGNEGTVYTNVVSALHKAGIAIPTANYVGGLGGKNISAEDIRQIFEDLSQGQQGLHFVGTGGEAD